MRETIAVVLAAGRGTRMKSDLPKVLHEILGRPMISYLLDTLDGVAGLIKERIIVAGYGSALLKNAVQGATVVVQKDLLGSGDAVRSAKKALGGYSGDILLLYGDTPLIREITVKSLISHHKGSDAAATILTAKVRDPRGYGRIVRDEENRVARIVEEEEARFSEGVTDEINVGVYCFRANDLFEALSETRPANRKKEYFLTDTVEILHKKGRHIDSLSTLDADEIIGVNSRIELAEVARIVRQRILKEHMSSGVTISDPSTTVIYPGVTIGRDTTVHGGTVIESGVNIGKSSSIGPFAHIRPGVRIGDHAEIGNFVELARTSVGDGARIKHHAYLGDAVVGRSVNVGASAITANFDGEKKNTTVIEDNAFIGVGAVLIAPVRIGKGAVVGAGAVVPKNHDVPKGKTVVGVPARPLDKSSTAQTQAAENAAPEERKKEKAVQRADAPLEGGKKTKARARKKARARRKSGARKKNKGLSRKRKAAPRKRKAKIQKRAVRAQKRKSSKKRKGR